MLQNRTLARLNFALGVPVSVLSRMSFVSLGGRGSQGNRHAYRTEQPSWRSPAGLFCDCARARRTDCRDPNPSDRSRSRTAQEPPGSARRTGSARLLSSRRAAGARDVLAAAFRNVCASRLEARRSTPPRRRPSTLRSPRPGQKCLFLSGTLSRSAAVLTYSLPPAFLLDSLSYSRRCPSRTRTRLSPCPASPRASPLGAQRRVTARCSARPPCPAAPGHTLCSPLYRRAERCRPTLTRWNPSLP
ncbi:MAG: hypothetical protein JWN21_2248 [Sphingomonas bacterium]|nr:hypothetical protein [Sphingomonas bacterium]